MAGATELARKDNGDVRLDYLVDGSGRIRVWEPRGKDALETTFRADGAVLLQNTVETKSIEERVRKTLSESCSADPVTVPYSSVVFERACPWCSKRSLVRFAEAYRSRGDVPVVPLYHCRECRGRSYYLTDEYLVHLIASNSDLFEPKEVERFKESQDAFVSEIRAYIISSFASKKVRKIE